MLLCKSWPLLTSLRYIYRSNQSRRAHTPPFKPTPRATARTILQLLQNCKSLQTLNIPISLTRSGVRACLAKARSVRHLSLTEMEAWGSHIERDCVEDLVELLATVAQSPQFGLYTPAWRQLADPPAHGYFDYHQISWPLRDPEIERCLIWRQVVTLLQRFRISNAQKR